MDTRTDSTVDNSVSEQPQTTQPPAQQKPGRSFAFSSLLDPVFIIVIAITAFVPRLLLAMKLDIVTDEVVYILGGKTYFPLLTHFDIANQQWLYNHEHPPFVKLLIGSVLALNTSLGHPFHDLLAARMPSVIFGTAVVVAMYWLGRGPFGRVVALFAALSLAVSPWLVYFSALAYLDMTMTALITIAFLILRYAIRRPWLYVVVALLIGLATDSKYTAVLAIPGMVLFTAYYFLAIRPHVPSEQRPAVPWLWWLAAILLAPLAFFVSDPAIWPNPLERLISSFAFEFNHSVNGHLTFLAGHYSLHVPHWAILYIILIKMSAFVTIPAAFFVLFAFVQLVRFHVQKTTMTATEATNVAFLLIWLLAILGMFSLLNIVVGTHYHLPIAPPVAFAGACGLATIFRYRRGLLFAVTTRIPTSNACNTTKETSQETSIALLTPKRRFQPLAGIVVVLLALMLVGPHLFGLTTVYAAEGYTSELFASENTTLQVAYPGYREAVQWLGAHTHGLAKVGLVALVNTLNNDHASVSWFSFNSDLPDRLKLVEAHPTDTSFPYGYLIWPMHLVQRGYAIPPQWKAHIVHVVMGGNTVYCYIMARFPANVSP